MSVRTKNNNSRGQTGRKRQSYKGKPTFSARWAVEERKAKKRLNEAVRRLKKRGYKIDLTGAEIYEREVKKPKRVRKESLNIFEKIGAETVYKYATKDGESGLEARKKERSTAAKKGAKTRLKNKALKQEKQTKPKKKKKKKKNKTSEPVEIVEVGLNNILSIVDRYPCIYRDEIKAILEIYAEKMEPQQLMDLLNQLDFSSKIEAYGMMANKMNELIEDLLLNLTRIGYNATDIQVIGNTLKESSFDDWSETKWLLENRK